MTSSRSPATIHDLPCELIAETFSYCTSYHELLELTLVSKAWNAAFETMKSSVLASVARNIIGPELFGNVLEILTYQRHSRTETIAITGTTYIVADYPKVKADLQKKFIFTLDDSKNVMKGLAKFKAVSKALKKHAETTIHKLDLKMSSFHKKSMTREKFYELWLAALRFGLESLTDWICRPEYVELMSAQKLLDWRLMATSMMDEEFVPVPFWAARSPWAYELDGNSLFTVLVRNYGSDLRVLEWAKCSVHYNSRLGIQPPNHEAYDYQEFYSYFHNKPLESMIHKFKLDEELA